MQNQRDSILSCFLWAKTYFFVNYFSPSDNIIFVEIDLVTKHQLISMRVSVTQKKNAALQLVVTTCARPISAEWHELQQRLYMPTEFMYIKTQLNK